MANRLGILTINYTLLSRKKPSQFEGVELSVYEQLGDLITSGAARLQGTFTFAADSGDERIDLTEVYSASFSPYSRSERRQRRQ